MGSLGMQEIIIIFILALIIFGPRKLPELGKTIGKGLAEFKKASNELKQTWEEEVRLDKEKEAMASIVNDVKGEVLFEKEKEAVTEIVKDVKGEVLFEKEKEAVTEIVDDVNKESSPLTQDTHQNNDASKGSKENP
jgi:sec-independent protein translocase protein TatA